MVRGVSSLASSSIDVPLPPAEASVALAQFLTDKKHRIVEDGTTGDLEIAFVTRKTLLSWELWGLATITATEAGSRIDLRLDTAPDRPKALLDEKKNRRSAGKLAEEIGAALG